VVFRPARDGVFDLVGPGHSGEASQSPDGALRDHFPAFLHHDALVGSAADPQASLRQVGSWLPWSDWGKYTLAGVGGQVLAQLGMTWDISKSLASNGPVLNLMIPVITAV
jgi:hypothetical protein